MGTSLSSSRGFLHFDMRIQYRFVVLTYFVFLTQNHFADSLFVTL